MTNNEYTPTTDEVEENYVYGQMTLSDHDAGAEFDRWLDTTIRQAKAEALREAADYLDSDRGGNSAGYKLRIRASRIEAGE